MAKSGFLAVGLNRLTRCFIGNPDEEAREKDRAQKEQALGERMQRLAQTVEYREFAGILGARLQVQVEQLTKEPNPEQVKALQQQIAVLKDVLELVPQLIETGRRAAETLEKGETHG